MNTPAPIKEESLVRMISRSTADLLAQLRAAADGCTSEEADGSSWRGVYLPNVGKGHSFAGKLSCLERIGKYRRTGDPNFGEVLMG